MYQALYRKWRPRTFDEVVGQGHITETLKRQIESGRLSHAYLFVGTRGTGKTSCAKILSRAVNCEHPVNGNPCNECPSCIGIENGAILDVAELDAASNNGVDNVRALRDEAVFTPASVKKRVYIIDEVHMMSGAAFNALLKILEEPPEHLIFILATTELHKIPATILSRCQRFSFRRLLPSDIEKRLSFVAEQENIDLTHDGAELLSRLADGAMRDALSLLDQCGKDGVIDRNRVLASVGLAGTEDTLKLFSQLSSGDTVAALTLLDSLYADGKDMPSLIDELTALSRDIMILKLSNSAEGLLSGSFSPEDLVSLAKNIRASRLIGWLDLLRETAADMPRSTNMRLSVELCLMRMGNPILGADPASLEERVSAIEKRLESGVTAIQPSPVGENYDAVSPAPQKNNIEHDSAPFDVVPAELSRPAAPETQTPVSDAAESAMPEVKTPAAPHAHTVSPSSDDFWEKVLNRVLPEVGTPIDIYLSNPSNTRAEYSNGVLTIFIKNPFLLSITDTPEVNAALKSAAAHVAGTPVPVKFALDDASARPTGDKLDALNKFGNVKFE